MREFTKGYNLCVLNRLSQRIETRTENESNTRRNGETDAQSGGRLFNVIESDLCLHCES